MSGAGDPSLATSLCGVALKNPVLAASGTFAYGLELASVVAGIAAANGMTTWLREDENDSDDGEGVRPEARVRVDIKVGELLVAEERRHEGSHLDRRQRGQVVAIPP